MCQKNMWTWETAIHFSFPTNIQWCLFFINGPPLWSFLKYLNMCWMNFYEKNVQRMNPDELTFHLVASTGHVCATHPVFLLDGLAQTFAQTFIIPRQSVVMTLVIP